MRRRLSARCALLLGAAALVTSGCSKDGGDEPKAASCADRFVTLNGHVEGSGDGCATFVGTTAAAEPDKSFWSTRVQLKQQPASSAFELSASFSRPKIDEVFPVELVFHGGNFGAAQGRYFFWESDAHWTGWQPADVAFTQPLKLQVRQRGQNVEGYVNGALVGTFTLNAAPSGGPVGLMFKSAKGSASKVSVADVLLKDL